MFALARRFFNRVSSSPKRPSEPELLCGKPRPMTGFFASLTEDQKKRALAYRGEENHGGSEFSLRKAPTRQ